MDNQPSNASTPLYDPANLVMTITRSQWDPKPLDAPATPGTQNAVPQSGIDPTWRERAACLGMNPDLFHPKGKGDDLYGAARGVCFSCPVRGDCLEEALAQPNDRHGMFGGMTPNERRAERKRRGGIVFVIRCVMCDAAFTTQRRVKQTCSPLCANRLASRQYRGRAA